MVGHCQGKFQLGALGCQVPALQIILHLNKLAHPAAGPVTQQPLHPHVGDALTVGQQIRPAGPARVGPWHHASKESGQCFRAPTVQRQSKAFSAGVSSDLPHSRAIVAVLSVQVVVVEVRQVPQDGCAPVPVAQLLQHLVL